MGAMLFLPSGWPDINGEQYRTSRATKTHR